MLLGYCSKRQRRAIAAAQHALLLYEDLFPAQVTVTVSAVESRKCDLAAKEDQGDLVTEPARRCMYMKQYTSVTEV